MLGALGALGAEQAGHGEFDGLGVERLAVVEGDAVTEAEVQAGAAVLDLPGFGQAGLEDELLVAENQAVEDVGGDGAPRHEERGDRVPVVGVLCLGDGQGAGGTGRADAEDEASRQNPSQHHLHSPASSEISAAPREPSRTGREGGDGRPGAGEPAMSTIPDVIGSEPALAGWFVTGDGASL